MKICNNCGAENHKNATYCITCGLNLTDTYVPLEQIAGGSKARVVIMMAVAIAIAGFAGALFMLNGGNKSKPAMTNSTEIPYDNNHTDNEDPMVAEPAAETPQTPKQKKLKNVENAAAREIDDATLSRITTKISHFINKNNKEDIEAILDYFNYPVNRYHNNYNVSRVKLKNLLKNTLQSGDAYHVLKADMSNGTVAFDGRNYEVIVFARYEWATADAPDEHLSKKLRLKYILNKQLLISSAYEMKLN